LKNRLKEIREELGLTQQGLANLANISRATVISVERGEKPIKGDTIMKIVKAVNKSATDIFFDLDVV
jgi:putative transcriptional regulator